MSVKHTINSPSSFMSRIGRASGLTPVRVESSELLDEGAGTSADVAANLAEMWKLNLYLGGVHALTKYLYPRVPDSESLTTIVDLGTGSAQMLVAIARWARAHHVRIHCIGVDWAARNLAVARRNVAGFPEITLLHADALRLPLPPNGADFVISSLFLHHLSPEQVGYLLSAALSTARRAVIMTDLVRGWLPILGFKLVQPVFAHNYLTRHDGELSIRRAYTCAELHELARAAGLSDGQIHTYFPWRMTLVADK
jgi:SAM-dependent methyltransferase